METLVCLFLEVGSFRLVCGSITNCVSFWIVYFNCLVEDCNLFSFRNVNDICLTYKSISWPIAWYYFDYFFVINKDEKGHWVWVLRKKKHIRFLCFENRRITQDLYMLKKIWDFESDKKWSLTERNKLLLKEKVQVLRQVNIYSNNQMLATQENFCSHIWKMKLIGPLETV